MTDLYFLTTMIIIGFFSCVYFLYEILREEAFKDQYDEHEDYFNYDIERMEEAMREAGETMPKIDSIEELDEWLDRDDKDV